jgi:hypothetical protein
LKEKEEDFARIQSKLLEKFTPAYCGKIFFFFLCDVVSFTANIISRLKLMMGKRTENLKGEYKK